MLIGQKLYDRTTGELWEYVGTHGGLIRIWRTDKGFRHVRRETMRMNGRRPRKKPSGGVKVGDTISVLIHPETDHATPELRAVVVHARDGSARRVRVQSGIHPVWSGCELRLPADCQATKSLKN